MRAIDVKHLGQEHVICCWEVDGVLVDPGPQSCEETLLEAIGGERPRALLLTHIHFDHAGAAGALVRRWPDLPVYVHERGAKHLVDPERLVASAARLYGGEEGLARLWGEVVPVPEENLRVLEGGETGIEDAFRVEYTPGHASHHVCYFHDDSGWAFVGDMAGVVVPPNPYTLAPTPPPDIDVEAWERSLERDRGLGAEGAGADALRRRRGSRPSSSSASARRCTSRRGWPASTTRRASSRPTRATSTSRPATAPTRSSRPLRSISSGSAWTGGAASQGRYPEAPMTETIELPRTGGPGSGLGDNWRVIVRNDDHNTFDHVALTLARTIPGVNVQKGYAYADAIHQSGQAMVWSGLKEPAELYWEQLNDAGLTMAPLEQG